MKFIDGNMLKQMIISGANNLFNHYPEVDALNVFPVPDGDTGINMNLTISSGAKEIQNRGDTDVYEIAKAFSKGLLMGARGNSGVILSQIFRGFAQALEGENVITPTVLADAFVNGKEVAYKAVMRPVEGTILTVIRESSEALKDRVYSASSMSIEKAFDILLEEANASLERTPELLPVLKEVGVVDSGGAGLLKVLEGFRSAIKGKVIEKSMATVTEDSMSSKAGAMVESDEFGYCTEFILRLPDEPTEAGKKAFVEKRFTSVLASHGNSLVVVRDEDIVKVHVHTLNPGNILVYAQQFGEFVKLKIENMTEQHTHLQEENRDPLAQNAKPEEVKEYAIISVSVGDGIEEMFRDLNVTEIVSGGQTMNPSTEDFIEAIKKCNAKKVFILPNNSNIVMAATQASEVTEDAEVRVIPTKTIPQGLTACMMFNPEASFDDNEQEMKEAISNVKSGQVTFAIRDTVIDDVEVKKDQFIALFGKKIVSCDKSKIQVTMNMLEEMIDDTSSIITLICGEDATDEEIDELSELITSKYDEVDLDVRKGNQPVYSFIIGVE